MTKNERAMLLKYLYCMEDRLHQNVIDCSYRFVRRDLDSVELLEEIIAKERYNAFKDFSADIMRILSLIDDT